MLSDLRHALRSLSRTPVFTAVAVLTLALCIGANSAVFSVVHAVLLEPYPWPHSDRLVYVYNSYPRLGLEDAGASIPDYLDRRAGVKGFADCALYTGEDFNLVTDGSPQRLVGLRATPSLFTTLEARPALGRVFTDADAQPGAPATVVLSDGLWRSAFGADPGIVGHTVRLNGRPLTVIGVMPRAFYFPSPRIQLWAPFVFTAAERSDNERGHEFSTMIARLRPGVTPAEVQSDLAVILARNAARLPGPATYWKSTGFTGRVGGFLERNVADVRAILWLVQAAVAAALLIGCANVASLLLARAVARERELAIRVALGAGRARLMRLLLTEGVVLFLAGGALSLLAASWGVSLLGSVGLSQLPRADGIRLDGSVVAFTFLCALLSGLVFGALPAWSVSRRDAGGVLRESGTRGTAGRRTQRLRGSLVIGEIALAVMLLTTAGLLIRSFARIEAQDPGFTPGGVLTAQLALPAARYDTPAKLTAFHDAVLARLRALPGVQAAGITTVLPFTGHNSEESYTLPEVDLPPGAASPHGQVRAVDTGYRRALGLTLLRGRWLEAADTAASPHVVVIDEILARRYWGGRDPLGHEIDLNPGLNHGPDLWRIVGVVAPIKVRYLEQHVTKETLYFPYAQAPDRNLALVVRTAGDPAALAGELRAAVQAVDPAQPVFDVRTMHQRMDDVAQPRRTPMLLLALFSGVSLLLAVLGVYGVLSFFVALRMGEFGVRLALGATGEHIAALVLRRAALLVGTGVGLGLAGYLALSRLVAHLLFQIAPTDPVILALAPAVLALTALVAALVPALRATRVDPIIALRAE